MAIVTHFVSAALTIQNIPAQRQGTPVECPTECSPCHNGCSCKLTKYPLQFLCGYSVKLKSRSSAQRRCSKRRSRTYCWRPHTMLRCFGSSHSPGVLISWSSLSSRCKGYSGDYVLTTSMTSTCRYTLASYMSNPLSCRKSASGWTKPLTVHPHSPDACKRHTEGSSSSSAKGGASVADRSICWVSGSF